MKRALISVAVTTAAVSLTAAPALASPAPTAATHTPKTYQVRRGDSYWSISRRYGVTMHALAAYNHADLQSTLYAGIRLRIPPQDWQSSATAAPSASTDAAVRSTTSEERSTSEHSTAPAATSYSPSGIWACIAQHESGGNPATDTGNGYYGMYQFTLSTWQAAGGTGNPANASAAEQTAVAQRVQQMQGWGAWPVSSVECGV